MYPERERNIYSLFQLNHHCYVTLMLGWGGWATEREREREKLSSEDWPSSANGGDKYLRGGQESADCFWGGLSGKMGWRKNTYRERRRQWERQGETGKQGVKEDVLHVSIFMWFSSQWQAHRLIRIRWTVAAAAPAEFQWHNQAGMWVSRQRDGGLRPGLQAFVCVCACRPSQTDVCVCISSRLCFPHLPWPSAT